jgi:hypothetical protein
MKKLYLLLAASVLICVGVFAQPTWQYNTWQDVENREGAYLPFDPYEYTISNLADGDSIIVDGEIDDIWENADTIDLTPVFDLAYSSAEMSENGEIFARMLYDSTHLYVLVVFDDDSVHLDDGMEMMYQRTYGGDPDGLPQNHDNNDDWEIFYWKKDGDRKFVMPGFLDVLNGNFIYGEGYCSTCNVEWLNQPTKEGVTFQLVPDQDSIMMAVDTFMTADGKWRYIQEYAFGWDTWLKRTEPVEVGDIIGFEISLRDYDDGELKHVANMSSPINGVYTLAYFAGKCTLGGELIVPETSIVGAGISIYPNPATNNVTIDGADNIEGVLITNIVGQVVQVENNTDNNISVAGLDAGIYFVNIEVNGQVVTKKLIVE